MENIYGRGYLRSRTIKCIYDTNGSPILDTKIKKMELNPDWMLGLTTNLKYKNFNNALFDVDTAGKSIR
jgi:hypothetical protein